MTTAVLDQPVTQHTSHKRPAHWCCLTQLDLPLIGLCGDLPLSQQRRTGVRVDCQKCLVEIPKHAATCALCAQRALTRSYL